MSIKKRIPSYDFFDFACAIAEAIDFVHFFFYKLSKDKFHPFCIVKLLKKEVAYKSFHTRFNDLTTWNRWSDVK